MSKTFKEVFDEISSNITMSKKGKPVKSFSRADFDKLAKAFLNDTGYKTEVAGLKGGELTLKEVMPVAEFRNMLKVILKDFGVDNAAAAPIIDKYEIRNVDGFYEVCSELIYQYMVAGKKFDFMTKSDFKGSMSIDDVGESVSKYKKIKKKGEEGLPDEFITVSKKAHKILNKKSKCPSWKKSKDGKKK
jgi:hypothetical protein